MDQPRALIVMVDELLVTEDLLLTVFTTAWMRIGDWPSVPILLVAESPAYRKRLRHAVIHRFVPVFATLSAAQAAVDTQPKRRRACVDLALTANSAQQARRFVDEVCDRWSLPETRADARLVATELVENAYLHADIRDDITLRLELRDELLTVAVADADPGEAVLREPSAGPRPYHGLHVVARMSKAWGCAPRWPSGKVVWATLGIGGRRQRS
ncbi:ATP-binding protein [Nocardia brasiliensis]|uniref:ATP-binding protein n=1 Tax=Nocardia brasiliensis TaxID=37326 RepID=UPI00366BA084